MRIAFKNVRKVKSVKKQKELMKGIIEKEVDVCAINETGLVGEEFVEMERGYSWIGSNRGTEEERGGGVGFIIKGGIETEILEEQEDLMAIKIRRTRKNVVIVNVYQACEGENQQKNERRMEEIRKLVMGASEDIVVVGGDMNGHVWELDGVENRNGRMIKKLVAESGMIMMNTYWEGMEKPTWSQGDREYRLDFVLMNIKAVERTKRAYVWDREEIIESDHCALVVELEVNKGRSKQRETKRKSGKKMRDEDWPEFRRRVEERMGREVDFREVILETAAELETPALRRRNREWWDEEVAEAVKRRKKKSKEARRKRKAHGGGSEVAKQAEREYKGCKEEAKEMIEKKIKEYHKRKWREFGEGRERAKNIYKELGRLMKGGKKREETLELKGDDGNMIRGEREIMREVERVWGKILNEGNPVEEGGEKRRAEMMNGDRRISAEELENALKCLKRGKAMDESGLRGEYLNEMGEGAKEKLRERLNEVMDGGAIPEEWREARVVLLHKGGEKTDLRNYRPVTIVDIEYKVLMMVLRERIQKWAEEGELMGDLQGGFRKGRMTEDNLFILNGLIELKKERGEELLVGCLDLEKAYDRVEREKLWQVLRRRGMSEGLVRILERVYDGVKVRFVLGNMKSEWVTVRRGVRQGCPLSPTLFNMYIAEVAEVLEEEGGGVQYTREGEEGEEMVCRDIKGMLYADDICIVADREREMVETMEKIHRVAVEYGLGISERKSMVVAVNGTNQERQWRMGEKIIKEADRAKYLGARVEGGRNGGIRLLEDRARDIGKTIGMLKFAAARSGNKFFVGREGWKGLIVGRLMYGAGAVGWRREEKRRIEQLQKDFGRWLWRFGGSVRNLCIRGETGWSTFEEREMKAKLLFVDRVINGGGRVSEVARGVLMEIGHRASWWREVKKLVEKLEMEDVVNLIWLRRMSPRGRRELSVSEMVTMKKVVSKKVEEFGRKVWAEGAGENEELREYVRWKKELKKEEYADGSDGARVRAMMRGGSLPVKDNSTVRWKWGGDTECMCGERETEQHVLVECVELREEREDLVEWWRGVMGAEDIMRGVKGFVEMEIDVERSLLNRVGRIWRVYERKARERVM